ncbi:MAG: ammonia-forming cytochrome c nitrite reductase subunit c552, partial [Bacteroidales bacterium]
FHSPTEALRVLGTSIQKAQEARILLTSIFNKYGVPYPIELPDISTREKAQEFIGLDMETIRQRKETWKEEVLPQWIGSI